MVSVEELRRIAEGVVFALEGAKQETEELHEILCAVGDDYNISLADGKDREAIERKRAKFKEMRKKWLLNRHAANAHAECKGIVTLLDELGW